jgi:hypothetical protein
VVFSERRASRCVRICIFKAEIEQLKVGLEIGKNEYGGDNNGTEKTGEFLKEKKKGTKRSLDKDSVAEAK